MPSSKHPVAPTLNHPVLMAVLSGVVVAVLAMGAVFEQTQEDEAKPSRVYKASVTVHPDTTAQVALRQVHATLWPNWVAAAPGESAREREALRDALAKDPNLVHLFDRIMDAVDQGVTENSDSLLYLVWAWNVYLDQQGQPWRLSAGVQLRGPDSAVFYVKTYHVIHDSETWVGSQATRTRVVQRVDNLSVVEGYLGLTSDHEQGAVVVADRVSELAVDRIWPLLDATLDPKRGALDAAFAPAIRSALQAHLSSDVWAELSQTAEDRFWLLAAVEAIHDRQSCGSTFRVSTLPFGGLSESDLTVARRFAAGTEGADCPDVTQLESIALTIRSRRLRNRGALRPSLQVLGGVVARTIAIHEARHAADDAAGHLDCLDCPDVLIGITRLEANAYLTSFADPLTGAIALYQACAVADQNVAGRGPSIRWLSDQLGEACTLGPPVDLNKRARDLRRALFGSPGLVALHSSFPERLPVP